MAAALSPWCAAGAGGATEPALDAQRLKRVDEAIAAAVAEGRIPGAVLRIQRAGAVYQIALGRKALEPVAEPLDAATVYDIASLTKVVATAPVLMRLIEEGTLDIDAPVRALLPAFESGPDITIRHLLTHSSGLPASVPLVPAWNGYDDALALACTQTATHAPGTFFRYSDVNFILLGEIAQQLGGKALDLLAHEWVFTPLGMHDTGYRPAVPSMGDAGAVGRIAVQRIAPTEREGEPGSAQVLRGVVHDPTARRMGGVAGHAGLFGTAADLARYASMLLAGGTLDGVRILNEASVARMTQLASPPALSARRGLGWDIDSPYSRPRGKRFPIGSFGHTGFTGCVLWIDPFSRTFHIFLSNRVHPTTRESIVALYEEVGTRVAEAVGGFDFDHVEGALPARTAR
jgi:CubicO group peptidase (beta-lactamase class C family)